MSISIVGFPFVISQSASGASVGRIAYQNLFVDSGAVVTASDYATGYPADNAIDWKQYDWWKQSATGTSWIKTVLTSANEANYFAVFGHNLHSVGGSVKAQYSTDGTTWTDTGAEVMPGNGNTIFAVFDSQTAKYWRCSITTTSGQALIAGVMIGKTLDLERDLTGGFSPAHLSPEVESKTPMSERGVNLGASIIRTGVNGNIKLSNITPEWIRDEWVPLIDHLNDGLPAVFCWDYEYHSDEAILIWKKGRIPDPSYSSASYMNASLMFDGVR